MKEFWDQRYKATEYAYGEEPNIFFKSQLDVLKPGVALFPAEGEGRNAVYAAKMGWQSIAFDQSEAGQHKAYLLAQKNKVTIQYGLHDFRHMPYGKNQFDLIALIYVHLKQQEKEIYFKELLHFLKPGGKLILEAFSKEQATLQTENPAAGGPRDIDMLFSKEEIKDIFSALNTQILIEEETLITEGLYHNGNCHIIRYVGEKPKD